MSFFPGRRKKIGIGRGLLLFRSWQLGLPAKKSEAESVSLTNKWRSRPKAKRGRWSLGVWFISVNSSSSFLNYVKILWMIQTSWFFQCSYLIALWESSNNHSAAKHCKNISSCESSSVVKLEHLMFSDVKNTNLPEMPRSCLHLLQQSKSELQCLKQTVTLNSCLPPKRKLLRKQALIFSLGEVDLIIFHHFILNTKKPKLLSVLLKGLVWGLGFLIFKKCNPLHALQQQIPWVCSFF